MKRPLLLIIGLVLLTIIACNEDFDGPDEEIKIPDFNFPQTVVFKQSLAAYDIFENTPADLIPANDFHLLELSAVLYTDHALKQRLVKVPAGTQIKRLNDGSIDFPDGTILVKTFFYYNDERDTSLGKRIIESRLIIKESNTWNVATYLWNETQTDATLALDGFDTQISWVSANGSSLSTLYHVPGENECMTCHQSNSSMTPLGPTLRNLNRMVERNGTSLNQINHLQSLGILNDFQLSRVPKIADYNDLSIPLAERGRAYLAMNCAHCHHPESWDRTTERDFDFRYETPLDQTGILFGEDKITRAVINGKMPFIGTTLLDHEGVSLITEYIESL